jgi:hypothetical protein
MRFHVEVPPRTILRACVALAGIAALWGSASGTVRAAATLSPLRVGASAPRSVSAVGAVGDPEPLLGEEWWRADVRVEGLTPPGPGVPLSIVDSGVFFGHQEFTGDTALVALNNQEPAPIGGVHGTAVTSVAAAPANGVGLLGLYPTASVRIYDASLGDGTRLPSTDIAAGILAASTVGRTVINLSLGGEGTDPVIDPAVAKAVRAGALIVAASGNSGEHGSPLSYPAASPHVLTVAATDQNDAVASFSSQSPFVDLAAPGVDIPVAAVFDARGAVCSTCFAAEPGTSFSSPMVAAAAAWVWTVRPTLDASQVAEILRRSARDVGPPGYDQATGYGILDMTAALATATPVSDPVEPNDDQASARTVSTSAHPSAKASGRVMAFDDPRDYLRVWLPKGKRLTITRSATSSVDLVLRSSTSARLARLGGTSSTRTVTYRNAASGRTAYLIVTPTAGVRSSDYGLTLSVR